MTDPIRTLDDVKARCEEVGNCWEWQLGYQNKGRTPAAAYGKIRLGARRLAWMLANGPLPEGWVVVSTCGNYRCVNPEHIKIMPERQARSKLSSKPISSARRAKIIATRRARHGVAPEIRVAALEMEGSCVTVGAALGIGASTVSKIRRSAPANNPWFGLVRGMA